MTTLVNHVLAIQAPKGVIPDLSKTGRGREHIEHYARFFDALAIGMVGSRPGETQVSASQGSTTAGLSRAYGIVTLATCVALSGIKVNGVPFTALATGVPTVAFNEFVISGTDAADATSLAAAIQASASAAIAGRVQAGNLATTVAAASVLAGDTVSVNGIVFTAVSGTRDRERTFDMSGSDTACAQSLAGAINAHPALSGLFICTNADGSAAVDSATVYVRQLSGTTALPITSPSATFTVGATAAVALVVVSSILPGTIGNDVTLEAMGVQASTTATVVSAVVTDTLVVNGQALTAIKQRATGTVTAATAIAGNTFSVNGIVFTGKAGASGVGFPNGFSVDTSDTACAADIVTQINAHPSLSGVVTATSSVGVVTIRAVTAGVAGNSILLTGTVTTLAASGANLSGGIAVANNQFDVSPGQTDTQTAAEIVRCIGASTTTLISAYVRATNLAGVVTVYSLLPGTVGNGITLSSTGGTITCAAARLAGGTVAAVEGAQASCTLTCTSVLTGQTCTINGVVYTSNTNTQANDQFSIAGGDNATAAALALAINNSTTAGSADIVATSATNVVTVKARRGGISGNLITVATGQGTIVISGAQTRLTAGAAPATVAFKAGRLSGGVGGDAAASAQLNFTA